jgi:hypothetical protein
MRRQAKTCQGTSLKNALKIAAEMTGEVFQGALVSSLIPGHHARPRQRKHLHRDFQVGALTGELKLHGVERYSERLAICLQRLGRDHLLVRDNDMVEGHPVKPWVIFWPAAE